jgi:hypothetical protein
MHDALDVFEDGEKYQGTMNWARSQANHLTTALLLSMQPTPLA